MDIVEQIMRPQSAGKGRAPFVGSAFDPALVSPEARDRMWVPVVYAPAAPLLGGPVPEGLAR